MTTIRADRSKGIWQKVCVACGYGGAELRGDLCEIGYQCPHCGQDLYARSPMSYAEMEGIEPAALVEEFSFSERDMTESLKLSWWAQVIDCVGKFFDGARSRQDV